MAHALDTRQADFGLAKLADDLLGGVSLPWQPDLLSNSPSLKFGLDQVSGACVDGPLLARC